MTGSCSGTFKDDGNALADADAHGAEGVAFVRALKFVRGGGDEARAAGAKRVSNGDAAAVGAYVRGVIGDAQSAQRGHDLRGEGFADFDEVDGAHLQVGTRESQFAGRYWAKAHDARRHAGDGGGDEARLGCEAETRYSLFRGDDQSGGAVVETGAIAGGDGAFGADEWL